MTKSGTTVRSQQKKNNTTVHITDNKPQVNGRLATIAIKNITERKRLNTKRLGFL